jgi:TetR/AcrR family transcriptional regulator
MIEPQSITETEVRILKAATEVFRARGRDGARMQEIADAAGINKAMLHYYFRSKDLLFERIFRESAAMFFLRIREVMANEEDLREKIRKLCGAYIDMGISEPFIPVFIIGEINRNPEAFIRKMFELHGIRTEFQKFKKAIETDIEQGGILPVDPIQLLMNMLSLCIFPAIARPMLQYNLAMSDKDFRQAMEDRKSIVPDLIIRSIQLP